MRIQAGRTRHPSSPLTRPILATLSPQQPTFGPGPAASFAPEIVDRHGSARRRRRPERAIRSASRPRRGHRRPWLPLAATARSTTPTPAGMWKTPWEAGPLAKVAVGGATSARSSRARQTSGSHGRRQLSATPVGSRASSKRETAPCPASPSMPAAVLKTLCMWVGRPRIVTAANCH